MIQLDLPNNEYHANKDYVSKSSLDLIDKSPAHFKHGFGDIGYETKTLGTALHGHVLEDATTYLVAPQIPRRSAADKDEWNDWFTEHGAIAVLENCDSASEWNEEFTRQTGIDVITPKQLEVLDGMRESIFANPRARLLLEQDGISEASIFNEYMGVKCRIRPDRMLSDIPMILDLKSTQSVNPRKFRYSVMDYRYDVQDAFYSAIFNEEVGEWPEFLFIACESKEPHTCVVYELTDKDKEVGLQMAEENLGTYRKCLETDTWPTVEPQQTISINRYTEDDYSEIENIGDLLA